MMHRKKTLVQTLEDLVNSAEEQKEEKVAARVHLEDAIEKLEEFETQADNVMAELKEISELQEELENDYGVDFS